MKVFTVACTLQSNIFLSFPESKQYAQESFYTKLSSMNIGQNKYKRVTRLHQLKVPGCFILINNFNKINGYTFKETAHFIHLTVIYKKG